MNTTNTPCPITNSNTITTITTRTLTTTSNQNQASNSTSSLPTTSTRFSTLLSSTLLLLLIFLFFTLFQIGHNLFNDDLYYNNNINNNEDITIITRLNLMTDQHIQYIQPPHIPPPTLSPYYTNIHPAGILCGKLCQIPRSWPRHLVQKTTVQSLLDSRITNPVDCKKLFSEEARKLVDDPIHQWPPPKFIPTQYRNEFRLFGRTLLVPNRKSSLFPDGTYFVEKTKSGNEAKDHWSAWTVTEIKKSMEQVVDGTLNGNYGPENVQALLVACKKHISSANHVLVVGSLTPWVESILLVCGVQKITTVEYGELPTNTHPNIQTMLPVQFSQQFLAGTLPQFDAAVTISSIEHSGLGRYGDQLNPWGDIIAMARISCTVKRNGIVMVGLNDADQDSIAWNAHRIYGPFRWPLLLTNFKVIDVQPLNDEWGQVIVTAKNELNVSSNNN
jgi:hypothetical protein